MEAWAAPYQTCGVLGGAERVGSGGKGFGAGGLEEWGRAGPHSRELSWEGKHACRLLNRVAMLKLAC